MITEIHKKIEPSTVVACSFCVWQFGDASVQVQLSGNSNRFESQIIPLLKGAVKEALTKSIKRLRDLGKP